MKHTSIVSIVIFFLLFSGSIICRGQEARSKTDIELGANLGFKFSPNGHTYGTIMSASYPFWMSENGFVSFSAGLHEDFQVRLERGFAGTSGSTITNGVHVSVGPSFHFLASRNLAVKFELFGGWSFKSTNGKVNNEELNINRSYSDKQHYFSRGVYIQTVYDVKPNLALSAFLKTDLRRLTDGDGILEYPTILYGVGVVKKLNCH